MTNVTCQTPGYGVSIAGMRNNEAYGKRAWTAWLLLSLLPACGRNAMGDKPDAPPDRPADLPAAPDTATPIEDLRPVEDLPPARERGPEVAPSDPVGDPPRKNDLPPSDLIIGDRPSDPVAFPDSLPDLVVDRLSDLARDGRDSPDLPGDRPAVVDLQNLDRPSGDDHRLSTDELVPHDSYLGPDGPDALGPVALCAASGGTVDTQSCCASVTDFRDLCGTATGACGCSPANSITVSICACSPPSCFLPGLGCVGPAATCTVGMDQTCNDSLLISSIRGRCVEGGRCVCPGGMSATSGKCL